MLMGLRLVIQEMVYSSIESAVKMYFIERPDSIDEYCS
jgi:hypothetical protein